MMKIRDGYNIIRNVLQRSVCFNKTVVTLYGFSDAAAMQNCCVPVGRIDTASAITDTGQLRSNVPSHGSSSGTANVHMQR